MYATESEFNGRDLSGDFHSKINEIIEEYQCGIRSLNSSASNLTEIHFRDTFAGDLLKGDSSDLYPKSFKEQKPTTICTSHFHVYDLRSDGIIVKIDFS